MFELNDCVAFVTNKATKTLITELEKRFEVFPATRVQWMALYFLEQNGNLCQKKLADLMGIKEPTTAGLIDRMEKEELVERIPDKNDRRTNLIQVTAKGHELNIKMTKVAEKFKNDAIKGISPIDLDIYLSVLDMMQKNVTEKRR